MKKIFFAICLLCFFDSYGQTTKRDTIYELKYNLMSAKEYLTYANSYSSIVEFKNLKNIIDSLELKLNAINEKLDAIPLPEEIVVEEAIPAGVETDIVTMDAPDAVEDAPDSSETSPQFKGDMEKSTMLDQVNPFKMMKSSFNIETGINSLHGKSGNINDAKVATGSSWFWSFSFLKEIVKTKAITMELGLGYHRNRFRFSNNVALEENGNNSKFALIPNTNSKPKLIVNYITMPLLATIKAGKNLKFYLGGTVGYRVGSCQKIETKVGIEEIKLEKNSSYGLNNWMYSAKGGIGIGKFEIIGQYHLSNMFATKNIYDYRIYSIGTLLKI